MSLRNRIKKISKLKHNVTTDEYNLSSILTQDGILDSVKKLGAKLAIEKDKLFTSLDGDKKVYKHTSKHWLKLPGVTKKESSWSKALWPVDDENYIMSKLANFYLIHVGNNNSGQEDKDRYTAFEAVIDNYGYSNTQGILKLAREIEEANKLILSFFSGSRAETYLQECEEYVIEHTPIKSLTNIFGREVSLKYAPGYRYIRRVLIDFSVDEIILWSRYRGKPEIESCIKENVAKPLQELGNTFENYQKYIFNHITVEREDENGTGI